ncbi:YceI family protein [Rufibacter glacialis]|uniref:YceI family protein n=1 Tax=Rufibacter glacialis TaxID=1259555 RepID=A0A5M8QS76_9BACT|nr:YceI family protein [Rufibacter glacialis]KAA6437516.1 YceI family protein [Rufibacter glacialis]GGK58666.1 lipid-binding protein [Rufibacter glacialis]
MKKLVLSCLVAATLGVSAFTLVSPNSPEKKTASVSKAAVQNYKVVPAESKITWVGRKVTGEHNGNITLASGTLLLEKAAIRGGTFVMDMTSITCNDLQGGSNKKLVDHLKADDFFSVEKNPTAKFAITNISPKQNAKAGTANYTITGDLTIKGITNQISFPALVTVKKGVATAKASLKFDRTKWDIKYRSGNFVENLGDKAILDDVELNIDLVAKQEAVAKK